MSEPVDPFSDEANPDAREAPGEGAPAGPALVARRSLLGLGASLPLALAGCVHPRPACPTVAGDDEHCKHRFCRHYRG